MERFPHRPFNSGFTLIELMIAVAILGVLAAIAIPRTTEMIASSREASTKGNLGAIRSALSIYYADMEGWYPSDGTAPRKAKKKPCLTCTASLEDLVDGGYLPDIPVATMPTNADNSGHDADDNTDPISITPGNQVVVTDRGGWAYQWNPAKVNWGLVLVNCNHTDRRGAVWTSF